MAERWKYTVVEVKAGFLTGGVNVERMQEALDRLGAQGWELVQVLQTQPFRHTQLVLKRPG